MMEKVRASVAVYPANCRSPRTRANSSELARIRHRFAGLRARLSRRFAFLAPFSCCKQVEPGGTRQPSVRQHRHSAELRRTFAGERRTFGGVRPGSPVLRRELANGSPGNSFAGRNTSTSNERSPRTSPPRPGFAANVKFGERLLSLHNPVARAARALAGRYTVRERGDRPNFEPRARTDILV